MKKGRLSKEEKTYIELHRNKKPVDIASDLDRSVSIILKHINTLPVKSIIEPGISEAIMQPVFKKHGLGGSPNRFVDDGTLCKEDRRIDKMLIGQNELTERPTKNRNPDVQSKCKKCGVTEKVPQNLSNKGIHLCKTCTVRIGG